jgi:hypothetical protein
VVLRGNDLEFKLRLVLNLHSNHLQVSKCYPDSKEGRYICTQINSQILKPLFSDFSGSFGI